MYGNKRILGLIPARGGSKGIKDKNIRDLCGKPLIAYSIEAAMNCELIDDVVVTTDSRTIADVALSYGAEVPFLRPSELASDTSKTIDAVLHALNELEKLGKVYDYLVLLQPTQPLRTADHISEALKTFVSNGCKGLVSVSQVNDHPILIRSILETGELAPLLGRDSTCRRQDMPPYYRVNGCIYINKVDEICYETGFNDNVVPYIMDRASSIDIDEEMDLAIAEAIIRSKLYTYEKYSIT